MSKFIRLYNSHTQYEADELLKPNVSRCRSEKHVHYNPNEIYLRGNIVIPYRGLVDTDSGGDDGGDIKKVKVAPLLGDTPSLGESTCYGDNVEPGIYNNSSLIKVGNDCTISYNSMNSDVDDNGKSFYGVDGYFVSFDASTEEPFLNYDERLYDSTGVKYYYDYEPVEMYFSINSDKDSLTSVMFNGDDILFGTLRNGVFSVFPKIVQKRILTTDDYYNGTNGTMVNAMLITDPESEIPFVTTNSRSVEITATQTATIISSALAENQSQLFSEIKVDGNVTTDSEVVLGDGTHSIEYKLNKKHIPEYGFALCTALSNVTISPKVKTIDSTAFEFCDLLDTDEKTIKRICTITEGDTKYEPVIIEAEFDDENIYAGPTSMGVFYFGDGDSGGGGDPKKGTVSDDYGVPAHYFAVYNGTSGLHVCSSNGGYSPK